VAAAALRSLHSRRGRAMPLLQALTRARGAM
jgi:hypothetical protein